MQTTGHFPSFGEVHSEVPWEAQTMVQLVLPTPLSARPAPPPCQCGNHWGGGRPSTPEVKHSYS